MKATFGILLIFFAVIALTGADGDAPPPPGVAVAADIRKTLPAGWTCTLISEKGSMGHPHGLEEPVFRLDFVNTNVTFKVDVAPGKVESEHPNIRLHFYPIADHKHVLE